MPPYDWSAFQKMAENELGLSNQQIKSRFRAMVPEVDESTHKFVLRVEAQRKVSRLPDTACVELFGRLFSSGFMDICERQRERLAIDGREFYWDHVVKIARD